MKSKLNKFFAWIIVFLLVLGLAGFGLQDVLSRWGSTKIATVGKMEISTKEFSQNFIREINYISQNLGKNISVEEAKSLGIHLRVLEQLINRSLLDQMLKDLKISIGDKALLKNIKSNTNFQNTKGEFDRGNYNLFLQQLNLTENEFENILRNDLSRELLTQVFNSKFEYNKNTLKKIADHVGQERIISIYKINDNFDELNLEIKNTDLKNYYEKNKEKYSTKASKKFSVLSLNDNLISKNVIIKEEEIKKTFNDRKKDFSQPEKRTLNRIVFSSKKLAEEALQKINNNNSSFMLIGEELNLNEDDLYLGTYSKSELEESLGNLIFNKNKKEYDIIGPVDGELGYELFEISKIIPAYSLKYKEAKNSIKKELATERSLSRLAEILPEVEDMIASGETLEEISENFFLNVEKIIIAEGENLPKNYNNKNLELFFDNATSDNSDLIQLDINSYISIRLDGESKSVIPSYESVLKNLIKDFEKEKKINYLEGKVVNLLKDDNFNKAIEQNKITFLYDENLKRYNNNISFLNKITIENLFKNSIGDFVIHKIINTSTPYFLAIKTKEIISADVKKEYNNILNNLQKNINEQLNNDLVVSLLNSLREKYNPKINFQLIDQIITNIQ